MLYTTLILTLGFLTVATTEFPPLQHFGLLGSLIILAALLGDLLVLPAFMAVLARWKRQGRIDAAPVERPPAGSATERLSAAETP